MALGAEQDLKTAEMTKNYFAGALKQPVEARLFTYDDLADAIAAGTVDVAFMSPLTYVKSARKTKLVLVRQSLHGGSSTYRSVVFVRKDSPIKKIEDLKGKTIAWIQSGSASGNLVPKAWLKAHKIDPDSFFHDQAYLADHEKVCNAVYSTHIDAGASFTNEPVVAGSSKLPTKIDGCQQALGDRAEQLRVLFATDPVPNDSIVVRADASGNLADSVAKAVDNLGASPEGRTLLKEGFHSEGFSTTDPGEFEALGKLLDASTDAK